MVLRPTRHKTGHFRDIPQANLLAWYGKLNIAQQKHTFTNQKTRTTTQNKHKKTKARFSHHSPPMISGLETKRAYSYFGTTYLLTETPTYLQPRDPHGAATQLTKHSHASKK